MTIKTVLLSLTLMLVALTLFLSGQSLLVAKKVHDNAAFAERTSPIIDELLTAAGQWAVERGKTNSALAYPKKVPEDVRKSILERRKKADAAYFHALEMLKDVDFKNKDKLIASTQKKYEEVVVLRKKVDESFDKSKMLRSAKLMRSWVPTMSALVIASQEIRYTVGSLFSQTDPVLASQTHTKHLAWIMSEYAGRERAIIGGAISANIALDSKKHDILARYRGRVEAAWDVVGKLKDTCTDENVVKAVTDAQKRYFGTFEDVRKAVYEAGLDGEPYPITAGEWIEKSTSAIDSILAIQKASTDETVRYVEHLKKTALKQLISSAVIAVIGLLMGIMAFTVILRKVVAPVKEMTSAMVSLSEGNTSVAIPAVGRKDEIGSMAGAVQVFKENAIRNAELEKQFREQAGIVEEEYREMRREAHMHLEAVVAVASRINDAFALLVGQLLESNALSSDSQAIASAIEEMVASIEEISRNTEEATNDAVSAKDVSESGIETTRSAVDAMTTISQTVTSGSETVQKLASVSEQIGEMVKSIDDISQQTNLLALNATIEAARAGEAGKGFAVVANEVKDLASQTGKVTEEISERIEMLQNEMDLVVASMGQSATAVSQGQETMERMGREMESISSGVTNVSSKMQEVSGILMQQSEASGEIGQTTSGIADRATRSKESLSRVLDAIDKAVAAVNERVEVFAALGTNMAIVNIAKNDHSKFKKRILDTLMGRDNWKADEVPDYRNCRLGKWYYGMSSPEIMAMPSYRKMEEPHAQVHKITKEILSLAEQGKIDAATEKVKELDAASKEIIGILDSISSELSKRDDENCTASTSTSSPASSNDSGGNNQPEENTGGTEEKEKKEKNTEEDSGKAEDGEQISKAA